MTVGNKTSVGLVISARDKKFMLFVAYLVIIPLVIFGVYVAGIKTCHRYYWNDDDTLRIKTTSQAALNCAIASNTIDAYSAHFARKFGWMPQVVPIADSSRVPVAKAVPEKASPVSPVAQAPVNEAPAPQGGNLDNVRDTLVLKGNCTAESHIAEGEIDSDLTKHQARFFCDTAVMSEFKDNERHIMLQFSDSKSHFAPILGYSGVMDDDGVNMSLQRVYMPGGIVINTDPQTDGLCKLFTEKGRTTSFFCAAKIDKEGRRTVPLVGFDINPKQ